MLLTLNDRPGTGLTVSADLFGGNHLYTMNDLSDGGSFSQAVGQVGLTNLRYPGGTMTETWGAAFYDDPNTLAAHVGGADTFVGLDTFLDWAAAQGRAATVVLPTSHLIVTDASGARVLDKAAIAKAAQFAAEVVRDHPDVQIDGFEIGNEYWADAVGFTSSEYGMVADAFATALQAAMDDVLGADATQPAILVQMADHWGPDFRTGGEYWGSGLTWREKITQSNADLLGELSDDARAAIDGVIEHYYYAEPKDTLTQGDIGFWATDRYFKEISYDLAQWQASFAASGHDPLDLTITEWGPDQNLQSQWGLYSAGIVVEMFEALLKLGTQSAFVWPVEYTGRTDLAGNANGDDGAFTGMLTPIGEAFRLMAEHTLGLELLNNGLSAADAKIESVEVNSFGSDERFVVFLSSRDDAAQSVTLDVSAYVGGYTAVIGERIMLAEDGAGWNEARRFATTEILSENDLGRGTLLDVTLGAYEVVMVEFTLAASDDTSELFLRGRARADLLRGQDGDDTILGRGGRDRLIGSDGDDYVHGNRGNDRLFGGVGEDSLSGGGGNDLIFAGGGNDVMAGGSGADVFVLRFGGDEILDFGRGNDRINLRGLDLSMRNLIITEVDDLFTRGAARDGVVVDYGQGAVFLVGVGLGEIGAEQFIF